MTNNRGEFHQSPFNGKKSAQLYFASLSVEYGPQKDKIGSTVLFVLPSTSGAARGFWDPKHWFQVADFVKRLMKG